MILTLLFLLPVSGWWRYCNSVLCDKVEWFGRILASLNTVDCQTWIFLICSGWFGKVLLKIGQQYFTQLSCVLYDDLKSFSLKEWCYPVDLRGGWMLIALWERIRIENQEYTRVGNRTLFIRVEIKLQFFFCITPLQLINWPTLRWYDQQLRSCLAAEVNQYVHPRRG